MSFQQPVHQYSDDTPTTPRWILVAFVIVFLLVGYLLYADFAGRARLVADVAQAGEKAKVLAAQMDQANTRMAEMRAKLEVTSQKLGLTQEEMARARSLAQTIRKEQQTGDERLAAQIGQVKVESETKIGQVSTELGGAIETTKKDLAETKGKLERTMGDLGVASGLIARNREDLEALKLRGERNIFEFALRRSKSPQKIGPVQLLLQKADPKRSKYTLTVYADDRAIEKRDKTVGEPVQFYVKGGRIPYEVVVFDLSKDRATGYLTTPKEAAAK